MYFHITISAPKKNCHKWGDFHYASSLAAVIRKLGHNAEVYALFQPLALTGNDDVVLRISGPHLEDPVDGVINLVWSISHVAYLEPELLRDYDRVFIASRIAVDLCKASGIHASFLAQKTEGSLFSPTMAPSDQEPLNLAFVGNANPKRGTRQIIKDVALMGYDLSVWGAGWENQIPEPMWKGTRLEQSDVARVYGRSHIVLNSHMSDMLVTGTMSNRTFDALAAGAQVVCDAVAGYKTGDIPGLWIARNRSELRKIIDHLLAKPRPDLATRMRQHDHIIKHFGTEVAGRRLIQAAQDCFAQKAVSKNGFAGKSPSRGNPALATAPAPDRYIAVETPALARRLSALISLKGIGATSQPKVIADSANLEAVPPKASVDLLLTPDGRDIFKPDRYGNDYVKWAQSTLWLEGLRQRKDLKLRVFADGLAPDDIQAIWKQTCDALTRAAIKPTDADWLALRQQLKSGTTGSDGSERIKRANTIMRRRTTFSVIGPNQLNTVRTPPHWLARHYEGLPGFLGGGIEVPDRVKTHVELPPLRESPITSGPVRVFIHLHYEELAPLFAKVLRNLPCDKSLYVSTDTQEKAAKIHDVMPEAVIRTVPNRGRDIYPKFFAFSDIYSAPDVHENDLVLHLHGKRSLHSDQLDGWLEHNLDALIKSRSRVNRILSLFNDIPKLGIIAPVPYPSVISAAHWSLNYRTACRLADMMGQPQPSASTELRFPVGSMFWARVGVLRPLVNLNLKPEDFPEEAMQRDGTVSHALERMTGVTCEYMGYKQIFMPPPNFKKFGRYRHSFKTNKDLLTWLNDQET